MNKRSAWAHHKYPNKEFVGSYQMAGRKIGATDYKERVFVLSYKRKNGTFHNIAFESWNMAKKLGWIKVK